MSSLKAVAFQLKAINYCNNLLLSNVNQNLTDIVETWKMNLCSRTAA